MDVEEWLAANGGVARAGEIAPTGGRRRSLGRLVEEGRVVNHGGGCYALPEADPAIVAATRTRGLVACVSAASAHGLAVLPLSTAPHVAVPVERNPRRLAPGARGAVTIHREPPGMLTTAAHPEFPHAERPVLVAAAVALARMLRCQDPLVAIAAIDSALNTRVCTPRDIASLIAGPGRPSALSLLQECDGRSQSPIESVARVTLRRGGLRVEAGVPIAGVGLVDLLVEGRVVVELDGFAYHSGRREYREDRRRDRELLAQGYLVLRFTWEDVMRDPGEVVRAVRAALARG